MRILRQVETGGGGALGYLGGCIRSLSKLKNTPKAPISGPKSTLILIHSPLGHRHLYPYNYPVFGKTCCYENQMIMGT